MKKLLLSVFILGLSFIGVLCLSVSPISASNNSFRPDSAIFHYHSGSILLFDTYRNNAQSLARMDSFVQANRSAIVSGAAHLALFGYIPASEVGNKRAVNSASIQASVVRAFLKTNYGIDHGCFTFAIDTTQNLSNVVQLQLVRGGIPTYANTEINYSESRNQGAIAAAFADYRNGIPYTSYYMVLARRNELVTGDGALYALDGSPVDSYGDGEQDYVDSSTDKTFYIKAANGSYIIASAGALSSGVGLYMLSSAGVYTPASAQDMLAFGPARQNATTGYNPSEKQGFIRTEPYAEAKGSMTARDYPVVGVKTNLLYWAAAMPNLELEFFMGKGVSLAVEGDYAWLSSALGQEKAYYVWGFSAEVRFWFRQNRRFDGFYAGVYGHTGQYDFKFGRVGNQGDYYGGGATFGYVLPLGKNFNIEFGLGLGYVQYTNLQYLWEPTMGKNVFNPENPDKRIKSFIGPTKLKVALLWKF